MPVSYRTYTPEDFLKLDDAHRFELIDGELVERNMGSLSSYIGLNFRSLPAAACQEWRRWRRHRF